MSSANVRRWTVVLCVLFVGAAVVVLQRKGQPVRIATTSPALAIENLNSQIASLEKLYAKHPERIEFRSQLFKSLATRAQFLGMFGDFARLESLVPANPTTAEEFLLKAKYFTTVHQFDEANIVLADATKLAPNSKELRRQTAPIRLARREGLLELREDQLTELKRDRTYGNFLLLAGIESELGNFEQADRYFEEAIDSYKDSSPFPIAQLYFQRGVMWAEKAGDDQRGRTYYLEAVHYLPQFVVAQVHLAELERTNGNRAEVVSALQSVATAKDPEPRGLLAELLHETGQSDQAASYIATATTDYNELLARYPLAFADHGSEFFSGPGNNPARALELAKLNLSNRRNERAFIVAINAAQAAKSTVELCSLVSAAKSLNPVFVPLTQLIQDSSEQCAASV